MIVIVGYPDMIRLPATVVTEAWGVEQITCRSVFKGAGTSDTPSQTKEELSGNDTSRHPKVLKIGPNHGCQ